jgi:prepilin-type N-terminal cleavage/methylation domain-containing protein
MRKSQKGFTLVELMVVLVILALIVVGVFSVVITQNKAYHSEEDIIDMQMNAQVALSEIIRTVRMAGFGCKDSFGTDFVSGNLATKGDVAPNPTTDLVSITNQAVGSPATPDQMTIVSALRYVGQITAIPAGNQITVDNLGNLEDDDTSIEKSYIFISPHADQSFNTIDAINSTTKTITTYENLNVQVNDLVYQVQAYTIRLVNGNLSLEGNVDASTANMEIAENIEDLQFQYGIDTNNDGTVDSWADNPADITQIKAARVFLLARTANPDREYTDRNIYTLAGVNVGPFNDNFHRYLLETTIMMRNLNF